MQGGRNACRHSASRRFGSRARPDLIVSRLLAMLSCPWIEPYMLEQLTVSATVSMGCSSHKPADGRPTHHESQRFVQKVWGPALVPNATLTGLATLNSLLSQYPIILINGPSMKTRMNEASISTYEEIPGSFCGLAGSRGFFAGWRHKHTDSVAAAAPVAAAASHRVRASGPARGRATGYLHHSTNRALCAATSRGLRAPAVLPAAGRVSPATRGLWAALRLRLAPARA